MPNIRPCTQCGTASAEGTLEGHCPSCLGLLAFGLAAPSADEALPPAGDYEILREIGRGGMGVVYEARQRRLNRRVAVKMLLAGAWARPDFKPRFRAEAEADARLHHPGIVTIHEVGEMDGQPFIAMELVEGPSLADLVCQHPLPFRRAARLVRLVAEAINHAHRSGVLHRDLKPSNVLLDANDLPRVTDFGLAKQLDSDVGLTRSGEVMGSPAYLPPEQVSGGPIEPSADVYSIGAILYELLTARPPFVADTVAATLEQVLHADPIPPRLLNATVPGDLETICLKCLQKEPHRRYPGAAELAHDIARFEAGEPILARPVSRLERLQLWCRRNPALSGVSAALIAAITLGTANITIQWRRAERSRDEMSLNLYAADVAAASSALRDGNVGRARGLLALHRSPGLPGTEASDLREFTHRLLWNRCRSDEIATLGEHPWIVTSVAVSPDGRWIAAGSQDQPGGNESTLTLWNHSTDPRTSTRLTTSNTLWSVQFTHDNRTLVSAGVDGVRFWDSTTGTPRTDLPEMPGQEASTAGNLVIASPNHPFFRATLPEPLWKLDLTTRRLERMTVRGWHPTLSPDGSRLAVMDAQQDLQLFDAGTGRHLFTVATNQLHFHLHFSPDGRHLVSSGQSTSARVWDLWSPGSPARAFPSSHNVWDATVSPDGSTLISVTSHQHIELWDFASATRRGTLVGHTNEVWAVAATPDGRQLVSGGKDRTVRLWSMDPRPAPPSVPSWRYFTPHLSPDGTRLLTYGQTNGRGRTLVWKFTSTSPQPELVGSLGGFPRGFAPDGIHVLSLRGDNAAVQWREAGTTNIHQTVPIQSVPTHLFVGEFALAGDCQSFSCPDETGTFRRWSTRSGELLGHWHDGELSNQIRSEFKGPQRPSHVLRGFAMSHSGRWLALGPFGMDGGYLVDFKTGRSARLRGHHDDIAALAFTRDESLLASGSVDGTIRLWTVPDGKLAGELPGHLESVEAVAFSPDGRTLASVNPGIEVTFWHIPTRRELARIAHPDLGAHVLFSPDGLHILLGITAGRIDTDDDRIEIWEAR